MIGTDLLVDGLASLGMSVAKASVVVGSLFAAWYARHVRDALVIGARVTQYLLYGLALLAVLVATGIVPGIDFGAISWIVSWLLDLLPIGFELG